MDFHWDDGSWVVRDVSLERRHELWMGPCRTEEAVLRVTTIIKLSSPGWRLMTFANAHFPGGKTSLMIRARSSTWMDLEGCFHFFRLWRCLKYSVDHRLQNESLCCWMSWHLDNRPILTSSRLGSGTARNSERMIKWPGFKAARSFTSSSDWFHGPSI